MSVLIRKLDDGYIVTDTRGPVIWEGAAASIEEAEMKARLRLYPHLPPPVVVLEPDGSKYNCTEGYTPEAPIGGVTLAERRFDEALEGEE